MDRITDAYGIDINGNVIIAGQLFDLKNNEQDFINFIRKGGLKTTIITNPYEDYILNLVNGRLRSKITIYSDYCALDMLARKKVGGSWTRYNATYGFKIIDRGAYFDGFTSRSITCESNDGPRYYNDEHINSEQIFETTYCRGLTYKFNCSIRTPFAYAIAEFQTWSDLIPKGIMPNVSEVTDEVTSYP